MVERLSDVNNSADTNYDSTVSTSRRHEVEYPSVVEELTREVVRLRHELAQVKEELEHLKH